MSTIISYLPGDTVEFANSMLGFPILEGGALIDPDTQVLVITDSNDTEVDSFDQTNTTRVSIGLYAFYYPIPSDAERGTWHLYWSATKGSYTSKQVFDFDVGP